jgi:hypothetical protein
MVRRAEFALGKAIRAGQEAGEIGSKDGGAATAHRLAHQGVSDATVLPSPADFATKAELSGRSEGIYAMSDGVTPEEFDV